MRYLRVILTIGIFLVYFPLNAYVTEKMNSSWTGNKDIKWSTGDFPVSYYINQNGTPDCPNEFTAIQNAFQTWENECRSFLDYTYAGTTNRTTPIQDGYNVCYWYESNWPYGSNIIAICHYWYTYWYHGSYIDSVRLDEFDISFNGVNYTWSSSGEAGKMDVENVTAHEAGHSFGLADLYAVADSQKTMYGYINNGETKKRTLEQDDRDGIAYLYPNDSQDRVWIKTADDDYGCVPYSGTFWLSPDISLSPDPPVLGQPDTIFVTVRNMRPTDQTATIIIEIHDPDVSLRARLGVLYADTLSDQNIPPGNRDTNNDGSSDWANPAGSGETTFVFIWTPSPNTFGEGHYCVVATVESGTDTLDDPDAPDDNDMAVHNFHIVKNRSAGDVDTLTFNAGNWHGINIYNILHLDPTGLPPGWYAYLDAPVDTPITLTPGQQYYPVHLYVEISPNANEGDTGTVQVICETFNEFMDPIGGGGIKVFYRVTGPTGIETGTPLYGFRNPVLSLNPNPLTGEGTIRFYLPKSEDDLRLVLYDVSGRKLDVLSVGKFKAGWHELEFRGEKLPQGVYFLHLETKGKSLTRKIILLR
jgi:hypothetical protein